MKNLGTRTMLRCCLLITPALLLLGCRSDAETTATIDPAGQYALVSVDGKAVPASVSHDGATLEVRSGTFTIKRDGTCSTKTVFVPPSGSEVSREVTATYTLDGSKLTMKWEGAGITTGTVEGKTFTMINEGMSFVYSKARADHP
jgi:hypothetical protein